MVCSTLKPLAREMDYLNKVLCRNSYPDWFLKKNLATGNIWIKPPTKESFVRVPYIQGLSEEFRRNFKDTKVQIISKGCNTLKSHNPLH